MNSLASLPVITLTLGLAGLAGAQTAQPLAASLPAGALLTLETRNAEPALERLTGLLSGAVVAAGDLSGDEEEEGSAESSVGAVQAVLGDLLGREGVAGVFAVQGARGTFSPELLAVARAGDLSGELLGGGLPDKPGARVGNYAFSRVGKVFAGQAGELVYVSTDKTLLMSYLGRLSGKAAPTLAASVPYAAATRAAGPQELSLYANFSAVAKVVRSQLARTGLPRLLSPVVDALDTLGQYAGGLTTTEEGMTTASAQVVNPAGKDAPLRRILGATTDFAVQDIIPADAESVQASACAPESQAYLGRWLTRLDLFEPFGFLTDSQLASHLERSGTYLGGECARVSLAGGTLAGLDISDPAVSLRYAVTYQRVTDQAAAEAHMPEYARSVNEAVEGLRGNFKTLLGSSLGALSGLGMSGGGLSAAELAALTRESAGTSLDDLDALLGKLKLVYGFRDGYLITAFSPEALAAAMDPATPALGQSEAFGAAGLTLTGSGGWSYQPNLPEISGEALASALPEDDETSEMMAPFTDVVADLVNRYDGMTSQRSVQGNVIIGKANVRYRW
ncbi:hypothetical protein [Deinococcus sp. Leaf326]|uniref:hypothetical protein n=1 Tax=Deinococcus sp. Leaf326 TaxID=1736338 RepID=UPI0006FAB5C3|nr:hypothetical protein [Deinococcus sp. Leaf326]KQR04534.1 hypothetical protein ASF71_10870 [Deinococcus sp. Leaf326]